MQSQSFSWIKISTDKPISTSNIFSRHPQATSHYWGKQKASLQAATVARAHRSEYLFRRLTKLAFRLARRWVHFDTQIHKGAHICLWCRTHKGCTQGQVKETLVRRCYRGTGRGIAVDYADTGRACCSDQKTLLHWKPDPFDQSALARGIA